MASRGLRCIALTYRDYSTTDASRPADFFADPERVDDGLIAMAVVGIKDPVRWVGGWVDRHAEAVDVGALTGAVC